MGNPTPPRADGVLMSFTGSAGPVPDPNPAAWHRVETTAMGLRVFDLYDERGHIVSIHWRGPEHSVTVHLARTGEVGTNPWGEPVKGWLMDGVQEIEHDGDDPVTVLRYTPDSRLWVPDDPATKRAAMTPLPTSNQIQAFLKEARDELDVIEQFHRPALRIARDHEISLKAGGGDGRASKGDHSDPTAAQATGTHDTSTQWARGLHDGYANGLTVLHSFAAVCLEAGKAGKAQARTQAKCANPFGCPDDAHAQSGRQGRCYSCWRFWRTHDSRDRNDRYHRTGLTPSSVPTPDLDEAEAVPIDAALPRRTVRDPKAKKAKRTKIRKARTAEERVARLREHMGHT